MKNHIIEQIQQAIKNKPGLDGVIHGRRRIKQGKHGSRSSLFFSAKNHAFLPVESRLELAFCYQLEADKKVVLYRTQALEIQYRKHPLYPDFLVVDRHGSPAVKEVKPLVFVGTERNQANFNYLSGVFGSAGIEFGVVTERDMWSRHVKLNQFFLYDRGGRLCPSDALSLVVVELVKSVPSSERTIARIRSEMRSAHLPAYLLEAAIFNGKLRCEMLSPIAASTRVGVSP